MKKAAATGSGVMIYILSCIQIGSDVQKLTEWNICHECDDRETTVS
jgi:hypothetical protein